MGDVNNVTGALTTALSDWSATIGGRTAFINKSERIPATTSEETRRIIGWPGWVFLAELLSTVSNNLWLPGWVVSPESAASKKIFLLLMTVWKIVTVLQVTIM